MRDESQWYYIVEDEEERRQEGPASSEELTAMLSAGKLSTETLVWRDGMTDWLQMSAVPNFEQLVPQYTSFSVPDALLAEPSLAEPSADTAMPAEPSDTVTVREFDNHHVQFSKSGNALLITTNDYHAGPLVLTKLDLLGLLVAMETPPPEK